MFSGMNNEISLRLRYGSICAHFKRIMDVTLSECRSGGGSEVEIATIRWCTKMWTVALRRKQSVRRVISCATFATDVAAT